VEAALSMSLYLRRGRKGRAHDDDDDEQNEPLMDGEVTISQEGYAPGAVRAYAHRDIKPGMLKK